MILATYTFHSDLTYHDFISVSLHDFLSCVPGGYTSIVSAPLLLIFYQTVNRRYDKLMRAISFFIYPRDPHKIASNYCHLFYNLVTNNLKHVVCFIALCLITTYRYYYSLPYIAGVFYIITFFYIACAFHSLACYVYPNMKSKNP